MISDTEQTLLLLTSAVILLGTLTVIRTCPVVGSADGLMRETFPSNVRPG